MDRNLTKLSMMTEHKPDDYVSGTPAERIALVWPMTREIASLSGKFDVEQRLQRHITRLIRREG